MKYLILFLLSFPAFADQIFVAKTDKITVALFDEKCKVSGISNLPLKATWTENGKTSQGCYGAMFNGALVAFYFDDKTVVILPAEAFQKVTGI